MAKEKNVKYDSVSLHGKGSEMGKDKLVTIKGNIHFHNSLMVNANECGIDKTSLCAPATRWTEAQEYGTTWPTSPTVILNQTHAEWTQRTCDVLQKMVIVKAELAGRRYNEVVLDVIEDVDKRRYDEIANSGKTW
ncbi:hypothetical protein VNO77_25607 [Canavalia gladiata]|uniref:Uncharacterized protein n=1 Tax=Canavalia gladiata TaxID=3824 RepID=A0AAN9QDQ2_CANGL